jgi:phosphatidyl-myo-inositol alpha-mannosyltransferase
VHRTFSKDVLPHLPDAQLWMVSDYCLESDGVRWFATPSDDELAELYSRAWVLAAPSLSEGFGVYYLEAMATDTMIVATPNTGAVYVLDQGRAGRLVADELFGPAIVEGLTDPDLRARYVASGRTRAAEFSWAGVVDAHVRAYKLAIARWSGRR